MRTYYSLLLVLLTSLLFSACGPIKKSAKNLDVDSLTAEDHRRFDYFYLEFLRLKNIDRLDAAFDMLRHAESIDSMNATVKYDLANCYLQLNKPQIAYDYIKKAVELDADNYWYNMMLANLAQDLGDETNSIEVYKRLIQKNPNKPELNYILAGVYTQKGDLQSAINSYDSLEQSMGMMGTLSIEKFKLYNALGNNESAFREIRKLVSAYPHEVSYKILLGDIYLEAGQTPDALAMYNQAEEQEPDNGYLFVSKANYYEKVGDKEAAGKEIEKALVNPKLDVDTKLRILKGYLSVLMARKEELALGYDLFKILLEQHPQEETLHKLYADFLISQGKLDEAKEQLQIAVDLSPGELSFWIPLMGISTNKGNYTEMIALGEKALGYLPDATDLYFYLGMGYMQNKEYKKAIEILEKGLTKVDVNNKPLLSDLYGQLGDVYHTDGHKEKAYESYERALVYNPKNIGVLNNYSYFLSLDKQELSKAERMSGEAVNLAPDNSTYLDTYAWVYFQQGNYSLAQFYLESAMNKGGKDNPDIIEHYGDVLYKLDDKDNAVIYWEKSLKLGNESKLLRKKIADRKYYEQ